MIKLDKKTGINLKKGSSINLEKKGIPLHKICVGLNWGAIRRGALLNAILGSKTVDLDASVSLFAGNNCVDTVYYQRLVSKEGAIRHSGDDLTGDMDGDDGLDNEVITANLKRLDSRINQIFFYLNSYKQQDFADIPYTKIRIYEGTPKKVSEVLATFNLSSDTSMAGYVSMIMGKLVKQADGSWKFHTIGEAIKAKDIKQTISYEGNLGTTKGTHKEFFFQLNPSVRYAIYDATIQGSFLNRSSPVTFDLKPIVFTSEIGVFYAKNNFNIGYIYNVETKKLKSANVPKTNDFGTIKINYLF